MITGADVEGSCTGIKNVTCSLRGTCPDCDGCYELAFAWDYCQIQAVCGPFTCDDAPTQQKCKDEGDAYGLCVDNFTGGNSTSCTYCTLGQDPADTCAESEYMACNFLELCPSCGPCQSAWLTYWNCLIPDSCGTLTCDDAGGEAAPAPPPPSSMSSSSSPASGGSTIASSPRPPSPAPTQPECGAEGNAFSLCTETYAGENNGTGDCTDCMLGQEQPTTCTEAEFVACNLMDLCPSCGPCQATWLAYSNCLVPEYCETFTCSDGSSS